MTNPNLHDLNDSLEMKNGVRFLKIRVEFDGTVDVFFLVFDHNTNERGVGDVLKCIFTFCPKVTKIGNLKKKHVSYFAIFIILVMRY